MKKILTVLALSGMLAAQATAYTSEGVTFRPGTDPGDTLYTGDSNGVAMDHHR